MADRNVVINAVVGYCLDAQKTQGRTAAAGLVDSCVTAICAEHEWRFLLKRSSSYTVLSDTSAEYERPVDFGTSRLMGALLNGRLSPEYKRLTPDQWVRYAEQIQDDGVTRHLEVTKANAVDRFKFTLINPPASGTVFAEDYYRKGVAGDIAFIDNETLVILRLAMMMPAQMLIAPMNFQSVYSRELAKAIAKDKSSSDPPPVFIDNPRTEASNRYISGLTS